MNFLTTCKTTLNNEYWNFFENIQEEMTRENFKECGDILIIIFERLVDLEKETKKIQKKFADKYMFDLEKDTQDWNEIERQFENQKKEFEKIKS